MASKASDAATGLAPWTNPKRATSIGGFVVEH